MNNNDLLQEKVLHVTDQIEKQLDAAIEEIDNLDMNDLEQIRKQRIQEMKDRQHKEKAWAQHGHGSYNELSHEKEFFDAIKKSENVVVHFFVPNSVRCAIVDRHFKVLAPNHLETKFVSLNAEKCPFLAEKLKIKVIPALICIKKGVMVDKLVGFTSLGNRDDFSTNILEWRLAQNGVVDYDGDLRVPPDQQVKESKVRQANSTIRDGMYSNKEDVDLDEDLYEASQSTVKKEVPKYDPTALSPEEEAELGLND